MLKSLLYSGPPLQSLHATFAKNGRIDTAAAIQSHAEILISAPVARVWQVLANALNWPAWMPGVKNVHLDSSVTPDATFTWKSGASNIKSRFAVVEPEREITWTGVASGAKAVDRHTLQATAGGTRVFTEECMAGPFLSLFFSSQKLHTSQQAFLRALKQAAEASA